MSRKVSHSRRSQLSSGTRQAVDLAEGIAWQALSNRGASTVLEAGRYMPHQRYSTGFSEREDQVDVTNDFWCTCLPSGVKVRKNKRGEKVVQDRKGNPDHDQKVQDVDRFSATSYEVGTASPPG